MTTPIDETPSVSVVIPTHDRPALVVRAVESVLAQDYEGHIECVVVFDQCAEHAIDAPSSGLPNRSLVSLTNSRTPGLAGARNAGVMASTGAIIGFLDDDDEWLPGKLDRQLRLWELHPEAAVVATGIQIRGEHGDRDRPAPEITSFQDFLRSRVIAVNPCTVLVRRRDFLGRIGTVDEDIPASFGEDYEWLLRATRLGPVYSVPDPLVRIHWNRPSLFASRWQGIADGLTYILAKVPEFETDPAGLSRIQGQIAFAHAALRRRAVALTWAMRALRNRPLELRALASLAVLAGVVSPDQLVRMVQRTGRGL